MTIPLEDERDLVHIPPYVTVISTKLFGGQLNIPTDLQTKLDYIPEFKLDVNCPLLGELDDDSINNTLVQILGIVYLTVNGQEICFNVIESHDA